jgi:hypothetical protein
MKTNQMDTKYTKWLYDRHNGHKNTNIFSCKTFQNLPKLGFAICQPWCLTVPTSNLGTSGLVGCRARLDLRDRFRCSSDTVGEMRVVMTRNRSSIATCL